MTQFLLTTDATAMAEAFVNLVRADRLDEAETALKALNDAHPETGDVLIFPVMLAIQRGRVMDAWQLVNGLPEDQSVELKALCLRLMDDPTWHGYAEAGLDHPNPYVDRAMRNLLGRSEETDIHDLLR